MRWGNRVDVSVDMLAARITGNESPGGTRHLKLFVCADFICLPNQQAFFYGPDGGSDGKFCVFSRLACGDLVRSYQSFENVIKYLVRSGATLNRPG